jgi:hypothetical protein
MRSALSLVALAALSLSACSDRGHAGEIPTEAAARAYLDRLVAKGQARDLEGFCELAGSMCTDNAEVSGGVAAMPRTRPIIAGTRLIPGTFDGNAGTGGGRLFVLCGTDGLGKEYRTETLVSVDYNGDLFAINGVYWSGAGLAVSQDTGEATAGAGIECPAR